MSPTQATTVLDKIRSRGFWRVVIRPTTFLERRIARVADLFPIVEKSSVRLRGSEYPHIGDPQTRRTGSEWVESEFDREDDLEVWRFYLSGLFVHFFTIAGDWRDHSNLWPAQPGWAPGRELYSLQTMFSLVEIFEFAARLALSPVGGSQMRVEIDKAGLKGRHLAASEGIFPSSYDFRTKAEEWKYLWEGSETELIASPRELATEAAHDLFARFGLSVELVKVLMTYQQRMSL